MPTPEDKAAEIERAMNDRKDADTAMNDKLDQLIEAMGGMGKRMDAMEANGADKHRADGTNTDEERKRTLDSDDDRKRQDGVQVTGQKPQSEIDAERKELVEAQLRADSVCTAFGEQAPPPMAGEKPLAYRIRLLKSYQHNSPEFKSVDLKTIGAGVTFDAIEGRIYADSITASATPNVPHGLLREIKTRDASGRTISKFYGEPRAWMDAFNQVPMIVEHINKDFK